MLCKDQEYSTIYTWHCVFICTLPVFCLLGFQRSPIFHSFLVILFPHSWLEPNSYLLMPLVLMLRFWSSQWPKWFWCFKDVKRQIEKQGTLHRIFFLFFKAIDKPLESELEIWEPERGGLVFSVLTTGWDDWSCCRTSISFPFLWHTNVAILTFFFVGSSAEGIINSCVLVSEEEVTQIIAMLFTLFTTEHKNPPSVLNESLFWSCKHIS